MHTKNRATILGIGGIFVIIVFLFWLGARSVNGSVPCLVPNVPLVTHLHPVLTIIIDGKKELIPGEIGLNARCERAVHTHSEDAGRGVIHVESQDVRNYTLGDFFSVWNTSLAREGYELRATVNGELAADPAVITLRDGEQIKLEYSSVFR